MKQMLLFFALLSLVACRQSSKKTFEKYVEVSIPESYCVLKDQYNDMGNDFVINWQIQLDQGGFNELEQSIKKSKTYIPAIILGNTLNGNESGWYKSRNGYKFYKAINEDFITVDLNNKTQIAKFIYCGK